MLDDPSATVFRSNTEKVIGKLLEQGWRVQVLADPIKRVPPG